MAAISEDVLERNRHLLGPGEDYWLAQRISRGISRVALPLSIAVTSAADIVPIFMKANGEFWDNLGYP